MKTTKRIRAMVELAKRVGYNVKEEDNRIAISPPIKGRPGLSIYPDGTAVRNDIPGEMATGIRSVAKMEYILNLHLGK